MTVARPAPDTTPRIAPAVLWFGLFGAAAAWSLQELIGFALIGHACYPSWEPLAVPHTRGAWATAAVISMGLLGVGVGGAVTALGSWRRARAEGVRGGTGREHHVAEVGEGRVRFMALSGLVVSGIILANLIMNAIVLFLVPPCG